MSVLCFLELVDEGLCAVCECFVFLGEHVGGGVDVVEKVLVCVFCFTACVWFECVVGLEVVFCELCFVVVGSVGELGFDVFEVVDGVLYFVGLSDDCWHCVFFRGVIVFSVIIVDFCGGGVGVDSLFWLTCFHGVL